MNTYPSTPKLRPTLWDGAVAALVAALAIVTALCFYGRRTGAPQTVTITHRGALIQTIRLTGLTGTKTVTIDGDYHLEIQVDSGGVCVVHSDCPGQDCVHTGRFTAPMYLLIFQNLLYFLALRVGRWRAGDRDGARSFLLYVPLLVVFLLAFGLLLRCAGL